MRTEHELVTECINKLLSSRVSSAASYFRNYMTAEENRLWPNIRQFMEDVEAMKRLTCQ